MNSHAHTLSVDFSMPGGTYIVAARSGTVLGNPIDTNTNACASGCENNVINIRHDIDQINSTGITVSADGSIGHYLHIMPGGACVGDGDRVAAGDIIGYSGHVGRSYLPHLHFEIIPNRDIPTKNITPTTVVTRDPRFLEQSYPDFTPGVPPAANVTPHSFVDLEELDLYANYSNINTGDLGIPKLLNVLGYGHQTNYVSANKRSASRNWCLINNKPLPEQKHHYESPVLNIPSDSCLEAQVNLNNPFSITNSLPVDVIVTTTLCNNDGNYGNAPSFRSNPAQRWHLTEEGYLKSSIHSKNGELLCLSLSSDPTDYTPKLRVCDDHPQHKWRYSDLTKQIISKFYPRECLEAPAAAGGNLRIAGCDGGANQQFDIDVHPALYNVADIAQKWTLTDDQHLKPSLYSDQCLSIDANFQPELQACEDVARQKWIYDESTMQIKTSFFRDGCLEVSSSTGQLLIPAACNDSNNQRFRYEAIPPLASLDDFSNP